MARELNKFMQERNLSGSKLKPKNDLFKINIHEPDKKRPGSGQLIQIVQSPIPPRKAPYSGQEKNRPPLHSGQISLVSSLRIPASKPIIEPQAQIVQSVQICAMQSPQKALQQKPPLQERRRPQNLQKSIKLAPIQNQRTVKSLDKLVDRQKSKEHQITPNYEANKFTWELQGGKSPNLQKKRSQIEATHRTKKLDFAMTMGKKELTQQLAPLQKDLALLQEERRLNHNSQVDHNQHLNMSEIQESEEDAQSLMGTQIQFYKK